MKGCHGTPFVCANNRTMIETILWWAMCAGAITIAWGATLPAARRNAEAVERRDREWQQIHWARQTALASRPDTCPPDVIAWLSQPLVPPDRATTFSLLSFQRCAAALGHDPARAQQDMLNQLQNVPRPR